MARRLHIDFETRSAVDLRKTGAYVYFDDATTAPWCMAYAFDDESVDLWVPGEPCPDDLKEHIESGGECVAHNAAFERLCFEKIMGPRYGFPVPKTTQWYCTMAMCYAQSLPGGLEDACKVVQSPIEKDAVGGRIMKQMAKPRRPRKDETPSGLLWWDDAERLTKLYAYCKRDVEAERELEKRILPLPKDEQRLWWLDQTINDRGVAIDVELCTAALAIVDEARERLDREMRHLTKGEVTGTNAVAQIKAYLRDFCDLNVDDGLDKTIIERLLTRDDISETARRILTLRREGSKTSVSKIDALLNGMQTDRRTRGLLQYHAASTGRWGGRRFQPQNLKRPTVDDVDTCIALVATGNLDLVQAAYGDALDAIGNCLRGMIVAEEGNVFCTADYSNVEGRVLAWLANENWKLQAFRDFDAGLSPDLYKVTAGSILAKPAASVTKEERQSVGKVSELAFGYAGGVGAFMVMAGERVDISEQYDALVEKADEDTLDSVEYGWKQRGARSGIDERKWRAAEIVKVLWRKNHSATKQLWVDLEEAAIKAVEDKGAVYRVGKLAFRVKGSFLFMQLPSRRTLAYAFPKIIWKDMPWSDKDGEPSRKRTLAFKGRDSVTGQWVEQDTYGGKLTENACQAVARDLLAYAMPRLEDAGYPTVLTVHDEAMSEVAEDFADLQKYEELISELPEWASGLPLVAEGWIEKRYRK